MTFALQAEIKQIAHDIRQRFDQVETVAKQDLHGMIEQMRALVAKLPGEVEVVEADVKEFTAAEVQMLLDKVRQQANADKQWAELEISDLKAKLAEARGVKIAPTLDMPILDGATTLTILPTQGAVGLPAPTVALQEATLAGTDPSVAAAT